MSITYRAAVRRGAKMLDAACADWRVKVDTSKLESWCYLHDVVAQVFDVHSWEDYAAAQKQLGFPDLRLVGLFPVAQLYTQKHWSRLDTLWIQEVNHGYTQYN